MQFRDLTLSGKMAREQTDACKEVKHIQNDFLFWNQVIAGSQERPEQAACDKLSISEGERAQTSAGVPILCQYVSSKMFFFSEKTSKEKRKLQKRKVTERRVVDGFRQDGVGV